MSYTLHIDILIYCDSSNSYKIFPLFILSLQLPDFLPEEHHFDVIVLVSMLVLTFDLLCYTVHYMNVSMHIYIQCNIPGTVNSNALELSLYAYATHTFHDHKLVSTYMYTHILTQIPHSHTHTLTHTGSWSANQHE